MLATTDTRDLISDYLAVIVVGQVIRLLVLARRPARRIQFSAINVDTGAVGMKKRIAYSTATIDDR